MTSKENTQFILSQVATNASLEDVIENYPGSGMIGEQYINAFKKFKITQFEKPEIFGKICKMFKVEIPKVEDKGIEILELLSSSIETAVEEDINIEPTGEVNLARRIIFAKLVSLLLLQRLVILVMNLKDLVRLNP